MVSAIGFTYMNSPTSKKHASFCVTGCQVIGILRSPQNHYGNPVVPLGFRWENDLPMAIQGWVFHIYDAIFFGYGSLQIPGLKSCL